MNDPRAVSRLERIEREKREKEMLGDEVRVDMHTKRPMMVSYNFAKDDEEDDE